MKLKHTKTIILTILIITLLFSSCTSEVSYIDDLEDDSPLRVYLLVNDRLDQLIVRDYGRSYNYSGALRWLEMITFDDAETMYDQLVKEMYAGGGPDIIVINSISSRYLDLYKIAQQNAFADMDILIENSEDFDLNDYNHLAMDTGIINGKRIMMPMGYNVNFSMGMEECFDYYNIKIPDKLTLPRYLDTIEEYYNKTPNMPVMLGIDEVCLLSQFFDMGQLIEKTDELKRLLDIIKIEHDRKTGFQMMDLDHAEWPYNFIQAHNWVYKNKFLFIDQVGQKESIPSRRFHLEYNVIETYWERKMLWFPQPFRENQPKEAYVEYGFVINSNSKHKNEAFKFIEFALSIIKQTTTNTINNPVRKDSFDKRKLEFDNGLNISYSDPWGFGGQGGPDYIPDEKYVPKEMVDEFMTYIENVDEFKYIGHFKYIYYNIMQSSIEDYYKDYITFDEMLDEINNKLKIYYSE